MRLAALPLATAAFSVLSWWLLPGPFLWLALAWALCFAWLARFARLRALRGLCVSSTILALAVAGAEALLWRRAVRDKQPTCQQEAEYPEGYFEPFHEVLGYGPTPGSTTHSRRVCEGELLYDVDYTIDARGLRVSPPSEATEGVVFFGGSFVFGEGVRDDQTLPYQFGLAASERLRVDNFGFHGYGPHQMLRALETGYVEELVPARPAAFVYMMIVLHVRRSAGMEPWDQHGPRYVLTEDGGVEYTGRFSDFPSPGALAWLFDRSYLWQRLHARTSDADLELCVAIVDGARREVERRFPGASFHVLLWDETRSTSDELEAGLNARGVELLRVSDALPGVREDELPYTLGRFDMHPSAASHERLARYLVEEVLGEEGEPGGAADQARSGSGSGAHDD